MEQMSDHKHNWSWWVHCEWCRELKCLDCGVRMHEDKVEQS